MRDGAAVVRGLLTFQVFRAPTFLVGRAVDFSNTPWMMPAIGKVARILIVSMMIGVGCRSWWE